MWNKKINKLKNVWNNKVGKTKVKKLLPHVIWQSQEPWLINIRWCKGESSESSKTIDSDNTSTNIENCEYIGSSHFKRKDFDSKIIGNGESLSSRSETLNAGYNYLKEIKLKNINRVSNKYQFLKK